MLSSIGFTDIGYCIISQVACTGNIDKSVFVPQTTGHIPTAHLTVIIVGRYLTVKKNGIWYNIFIAIQQVRNRKKTIDYLIFLYLNFLVNNRSKLV